MGIELHRLGQPRMLRTPRSRRNPGTGTYRVVGRGLTLRVSGAGQLVDVVHASSSEPNPDLPSNSTHMPSSALRPCRRADSSAAWLLA